MNGNNRGGRVPVSVIVLTYNEEANIAHCLQSVGQLGAEVFVVDSYSTDGTLALARRYTPHIFQNAWVHWAQQRNWALDNLPLRHEWVFFLDADEEVTPAFCQELAARLRRAPAQLAAFLVRFDFYFLNRRLCYAYESPPVLRLVRRHRARWEGEGAREYARVDGEVGMLRSRLRHWDRKPLAAWIAKQTTNAQKEAEFRGVGTLPSNEAKCLSKGQNQERPWRRWLRQCLYPRLPRFWRALGYFLYRYGLRGGFLDGRAGFAYCFLQGLWLPLIIDMMQQEKGWQQYEQIHCDKGL